MSYPREQDHKLWITFGTMGMVPLSIPRRLLRPENRVENGLAHPHLHGEGFPAAHLDALDVIHNPQPLLPLLHTSLSISLKGDWGHSRKDRLR